MTGTLPSPLSHDKTTTGEGPLSDSTPCGLQDDALEATHDLYLLESRLPGSEGRA
jgi:hypothetical protein